MKIIVYSPAYQQASGGIVVLHKLVDLLIKQGFDAGFFIPGKAAITEVEGSGFTINPNNKWNGFTIDEIDKANDIVVYPEIVHSNPLEVKRVVRYILNAPYVTKTRIPTWGKDDSWIYYSKKFYDGNKPEVILNIQDAKLNSFFDKGMPRSSRPYDCFTYRKNNDKVNELNIIHGKDAIEFGFNMTDEYLIKVFNSCKRFYCYDTESYLPLLASLCGCDAIVVPTKTSNREDVMDKQLCMKYGVAYGVDEIELARETRFKLEPYLVNQESEQAEAVEAIFNRIIIDKFPVTHTIRP